tara:strand:- start:1560 stop:2519 length:960 start_codon:yes stop_codon:yes gene_type:complete
MYNFDEIIGQDLAIELLSSAISKQHIAPAYLFAGPAGVGRKKTAKLFIKAILNNCIDLEITRRKVDNNNHPDILWIEPSYLIQGKSISQKKAKIDNLNIKSPPQIRINQIKDIIDFLGKKPLESSKSIVIIEDIERMNESASNALLKTLEEPKEGIFILTSQKPEKILNTIHSRCQIIPFKRLKNDQLEKVINQIERIQETDEISKEEIRDLIIFSNGSPGLYQTNLEHWLNTPSHIRSKIDLTMSNEIEVITLAKEITDELNVEQQLWLINFQQNRIWKKENNLKIIKQLEKLRKQILSFVQPRLAWEVTLLEINFIN